MGEGKKTNRTREESQVVCVWLGIWGCFGCRFLGEFVFEVLYFREVGLMYFTVDGRGCYCTVEGVCCQVLHSFIDIFTH